MTIASLSAVFRATDRELWLLTSQAGDRRGGLIATCVAEASIVPDMPRVLVCLARHHATSALVRMPSSRYPVQWIAGAMLAIIQGCP